MDWAALIVTFVGVTMLTDHQRKGWLVAIAGSLLWIVFALQVGSGGLLCQSIGFVGIHLWGWTRWGRVRG